MSSISSAGVDIAFQALLSLVVVLPLAGEEVAVLDAAGGKTEPSAWGVLSYFKPAAQKGAASLLLSLTTQVQGFHIVRFCSVTHKRIQHHATKPFTAPASEQLQHVLKNTRMRHKRQLSSSK